MITYTFKKSQTHTIVLGTDTNTHEFLIRKVTAGYYQVLDNNVMVAKVMVTLDGMNRFTGKWHWEFVPAIANEVPYGCRISSNSFYGPKGYLEAITAFGKVYEGFCREFAEQKQVA